MELDQVQDFSVTLTKEDFTKNLKFPFTSPEFWAGRKEPLSSDETKMRQSKLGESRWVAAVLPDICAWLASVASRINTLCGSDAYRTNELVRVAKDWRQATALKYALSSRPWRTLGVVGKAEDGLFPEGRRCIAVRRHYLDGRMRLTGASRRKESADWDML